MRFGLHSGQHRVSFDELRRLWLHAAQAGFDACYVFDHFRPLHSGNEAFLPEETDGADGGCLEGLATLAALARAVPTVAVGIMVASVGYRPLGLLGSSLATLVQAAPGRIELGVGAGWFEREYLEYGYDFPPAGQRMDDLERALEAVAAWFRDEPGRLGKHEEARIPPLHPLPRLWVAGTGEKRLLPLAATYADSWNAMYLTPEEFAQKVSVLDEACAARGRRPGSIERSIALRAFCSADGASAHAALEAQAARRGADAERLRARSLAGTPAECADRLAEYAAAGATHLTVMVHPPYDLDSSALLGSEVFPLFR